MEEKDREKVSSWEDIEANLKTLNEEKDELKRNYYTEILKSGICIVAFECNGEYLFGPSRFVGYKDNDATHKDKKSDGGKTNPVIDKILGEHKLHTEFAGLDEKFIEFVRKHGGEPHNKKRKYWFKKTESNDYYQNSDNKVKKSGKLESRGQVKRLAVEIIPKGNVSQFPYESHSWRVISASVFIKKMDKSSFIYKGTSIPADIREFFGIENMKFGNKINIILVHRNLEYDAFFTIDKLPVPRTRLFWHSNFTKLLNKELPGWFNLFKENDLIEEPPLLRFQLLGPSRYKVEIINPRVIDLDIEADSDELVYEGDVKYHYSKVYKRNLENRKRAIEIHGLQCVVCGFDLESHYGVRGAGFIEIHHNKPLFSIGEEIVVNPETDLVPVCSNCHRMIHRSKDKILKVEELRELYKDNK